MDDQTLSVTHSKRLPNGNHIERVQIPLSTNNNPVYWESGGGSTNTGKATIVTDRFYQRLKPLYIKRKGRLSNYNHAMLPLKKGYKIITIVHHRQDFDITIREVKQIEGNIATFEIIAKYSKDTQRGWEKQLSSDAIEAGIAKSKHYHCREPHFIIE